MPRFICRKCYAGRQIICDFPASKRAACDETDLLAGMKWPGYARCPHCNCTVWNRPRLARNIGMKFAVILVFLAMWSMNSVPDGPVWVIPFGLLGLVCCGLPLIPYAFLQGGVYRGIAAVFAFFVLGFLVLQLGHHLVAWYINDAIRDGRHIDWRSTGGPWTIGAVGIGGGVARMILGDMKD